MSDIDLINLFKLPPEEAIAYFKSKGYAFSWDWQDVWQEAQARSFTVAKAMRLDVLQTIRDEVQAVLDEGMLFRDFQKNLEPRLKALGWWGKHEIVDADGVVSSVQLGSPYRLKTIYQTNLRTAMSAGQWRDYQRTIDVAPYGQYDAVLDRQTRPTHRALHGKVFRLDDPFWNTHWPPNGWGCRCGVRRLRERDLQRKRLEVSSSEGTLSTETLMSGGREAKVTVWTDPDTGLKVAPDPGWNYNPGKTKWKPDLSKYDKDIAKLF